MEALLFPTFLKFIYSLVPIGHLPRQLRSIQALETRMADAQTAFDAFVDERSKLENVKRTPQNLNLHLEFNDLGKIVSRIQGMHIYRTTYIYTCITFKDSKLQFPQKK